MNCLVGQFGRTFLILVSTAMLVILFTFAVTRDVPRMTAPLFEISPATDKLADGAAVDNSTLAFRQAMHWRAKHGVIILAMIDTSFVEMAVNFYETSLKPFNIRNFLFVGASRNACLPLHARRLPCFGYADDPAGSTPSVYLSRDFLRKMNIRTNMILDALGVGLTVIHTDIDVIFLRNPMPILDHIPADVDIAPLWDDGAYNAGFVLVRPSWNGKWIYQRSREMTDANSRLDDQKSLNRAIAESVRSNSGRVLKLDQTEFLNGLAYFESTRRMFANEEPCETCVVVHNNWLVSKEAKIYRFKEHHMWVLDGPNRYYTDPSRKYIVYSNPMLQGQNKDMVIEAEKRSLVNALAIGIVLNRTVILAPLHCGKHMDLLCPLNARIKISTFDSEFGDSYRETTFLSHPLVPENVSRSVSELFLIETDSVKSDVEGGVLAGVPLSVRRLTPSSLSEGATSSEISHWFGGEKSSVLQFHSLYGAFAGFDDSGEQAEFQRKVSNAFIDSDYRQLKNRW